MPSVGGGPIIPAPQPPHIDNELPQPPPGIWPPPVEIWPPVALPPGYPMPPGSIWPPVIWGGPMPQPPEVDNTLPPAGGGSPPTVDNTLPGQQPGIDNTLPSQKFLVAIVAASAAGGLQVIGYTVVDPSLEVGLPLPGEPPVVDNTLPPYAQPKRRWGRR